MNTEQPKILVKDLHDSGVIIKAMNSELRRSILGLLIKQALNINEIAEALDIPQSTCATNVKMLEEAGILTVQQLPAKKGSQKVCSVSCSEIVIQLFDVKSKEISNSIETEMPIGMYTNYQVSPPCGLVSDTSVIGFYDNTNSFLDPHRAHAQLIWFKDGFLEYRFPINTPARRKISGVSVIAEVCSEFPGYNSHWPSDITVWINSSEIGTWTSPGDMGGERGILTPDWWSSRDTQYGFKKTWNVTSEGSFIDGVNSNNVTLMDLELEHCEHITIRFGIKDSAENRGGLNLFGKTFGNYDNDIILRLDLENSD